MTGILVTGGTGFLGRQVVEELDRGGAEVHVTSRSGVGKDVHALDLHEGDVEALVQRLRPDVLVHLAWTAGAGTYRSSPDNLDWVGSSLRLARAFVDAGGRRLVVAGSAAEYDWQAAHHGVCREDETPLRPVSLYGGAKAGLGTTLSSYATEAGIELAWCRFFWLYGPGEHPDRLVASVARALSVGRSVATSAGDQERDYLDVRDAGAALAEVAIGRVAGSVNIGSGQGVPVGWVAEELGRLIGRPELVCRGARPATDDDAVAGRVVADVRRLREDVGVPPGRPLEDGLAQALEWWQERM